MFKILQCCTVTSKYQIRKSMFMNIVTRNRSFHRHIKALVPKIKPEPKDIKCVMKCMSSCLGVCLGFGIYKSKYYTIVSCQSKNRLQGITKDDKNLKFDWKLFWKYIKPHLLNLIGAIVAALVVAFLNIKIPQLLGNIIDVVSKYSQEVINSESGDAVGGNFFKEMRIPSIDLFFMYAAQSAFTFLYIYLLSGIGEKLATNVRQDLFESILRQDIKFFDQHRTGELVNRLTTDVQDLKSSFKQCISQGLRAFAQLIGGAASLFIISPTLSSIALICIPTAVVIGSYVGSVLRKKSKQAQAQTERATGILDEAIANIRTVRAFAMEETEAELFSREALRAQDLNEQLGFGIAVFQAATNLFLNGLVLGTLYLGGSLLINQELSAGDLMAFLVASQTVQRSLAQGSLLLGSVVRGMSAGARVMEYIDIKPEVPLIGGKTLSHEELLGQITFDKVSFSYPARPRNTVLKDFSLAIPAGKTVAIVGISGSGKSTVANLLERFYEPSEGSIYLDGLSLTDLCPKWLRGTGLGLIDQNPTLFATTIMENIRYGKPDASDAEVIEAAHQANAHEFIGTFSNGYNTLVGERGTALSGGQKQRVAIARALLKNPKILILDEATSALDTQSEALVQAALDNASRGRTVIVIAHRLSTIRNADVIVVMRHGRIVEIGNHDTLKQAKGHYWNLVKQQENDNDVPDDKQEKTKTTRIGAN